MSQRLAPYLRYYSSHRPTDDNGVRPAVLVVFDDDTAATHFLRLAREETARSEIDGPPVGLSRGRHRRPGAAGTRMAHPQRLGARPSVAEPAAQRIGKR